MRKILVLIIFPILFGGCKKELYTAAVKSITVDGSDQDWEASLYRKVDDANLVYAVSKDAEKLYVLIKATDEQTMRKIMLLGTTIWIDGKGKNKERQGIVYPQGVKDPIFLNKITTKMKEGMTNRNRDNKERDPAALLENPEMMEIMARNKNYIGLINFQQDSESIFTYELSKLELPIEAHFKRGEGKEVIYELAVPIDLIKKRKKSVVSIGIETHTIDIKGMMSQNMGGMGAGGRFGMARRMPGGMGRRMPGGMGGGNSGDMQQRQSEFKELNKPIKEWIKIEL